MLNLILSSAVVLLLSFDGLRPDQVTPKTAPHFRSIGQNGVSAEYMEPSFPASTFINHTSIITGCNTEEHGIVSNHFIDPKKGKFRMEDEADWIECEPLWAAASRQNINTAIYTWPIAQTPWHGAAPAYKVPLPADKRKKEKFFARFDDKKEWKQILDWLKLPETKRPQLILGYFPDVDSLGHKYGPHSPKTLAAVKKYDRQFALFLKDLQKLGLNEKINIVLVSDHGMAEGKKFIDTDPAINGLKEKIPGSWQFMTTSGTLINFYFDNAKQTAVAQNFLKKSGNFHVYSAAQFPKHWHYNNPRSGQMVVTADPPHVMWSETRKPKKPALGYHGYDPKNREMRAFFAAEGPAFKPTQLKAIRNIDVAPTIAKILGISFKDTRSGKAVEGILK